VTGIIENPGSTLYPTWTATSSCGCGHRIPEWEEVYMKQPKGYVKEGKEYLVCKLSKSIYGLKQSPRCWNTALT
jgi:hypothetical protein